LFRRLRRIQLKVKAKNIINLFASNKKGKIF
jgi:hypothetical protein